MKAPVVRLKIRVRLTDGSRPYLDPVFAANGKLKPGYAILDGVAGHYPGSVYHLRYLKGGKRVWEPVGPDAQLAAIAKVKREKALGAIAAGIPIAEDGLTAPKSIHLQEAVAEYLEEVRAHRSRKTNSAYTIALKLFLEACPKKRVEEITRKDVLGYIAHLKGQGNAPRTVANRVANVKRFFNTVGAEWPLKREDKPKYTEKAVTAYSSGEVRQLLAAADGEESELLQFFLFTGGREQEVQYATWADIDFEGKTFTVREKLDLRFTPKDKEEGEIPIPDSLIELLQQRRRLYPDKRLIFSNSQGNPDGHLLRVLKRVAKQAGLNCGHCYTKTGRSCATTATCSKWGLHRLRKTFATMHHEAGVPARTIQRWLRHSSLDTTLRYLAASDDRSAKTREQVNKTFSFLQAA